MYSMTVSAYKCMLVLACTWVIGVRQLFLLCFLKEILKDVFLFRFQLKTDVSKYFIVIHPFGFNPYRVLILNKMFLSSRNKLKR